MKASELQSPNKGRVLILDDEPHQRLIMEQAVTSLGYEADVVDSGETALQRLRAESFDVLLTDLKMPGMDGLKVLSLAAIADPTVSVIVVTAHGTIETAVEAMKKGAEDYVTKPVEFDALELILKRVFGKRALMRENRRLQSENEALKHNLEIRYHLTDAIGKSARAAKLLSDIRRYMKIRVPVIVMGEPGVGRTEIAQMIHYNSPWAKNDLMVFDCSAVPEEFHEAHLFGEESSVEGGVKTSSRPGLVEKAHLGTLVIAEVHRLHPSAQAHLARALREEKTQRTGGTKFYHAYVRVIATSSEEAFEKAAKEKGFKKDIYDLFRENSIAVAPLRERQDDIPILIAATAKRAGERLGKGIQKIDKSVVDRLMQHDFPGNNRELEAMVEAAVIRCNEETLRIEHFAFHQTPKGQKA